MTEPTDLLTSKLSIKVRELLRERPAYRTLKEIARECKVDYANLSAFHSGLRPIASAAMLERLYECLTGKPLEY